MLAEPGKSPDESLNPDSERTLKKSGFVTREPISIFSRIKNAKDEEEKKKLNQLLETLETLRKKLPEGFKIGAAVGEGDCFFDSIAQGLNELKDKGLIAGSKGFSVKSLRENCKQYAQQVNQSKKGSWLDSALKREGEKLYEYIPRIEFTAEDIENASSDSTIRILKLEGAIWGRPEIEGKMICEKYGVKIRIIELRNEEIDGLHVTKGKIGTGENVIYIVNYRNHFVPLLNNIERNIEEERSVSIEEVYGVVNKSSPSLLEDIRNYDFGESTINTEGSSSHKQSSNLRSKQARASESAGVENNLAFRDTTSSKSPKGTLNSGGDGAEDFVQINVPYDGSCLFWSVALAYLIPSKDNEVLFKKRCMDLFGKEGDQDSVRKFILSEAFRDGLHKNQFYRGILADKMSDLVQKVFRAKVVEYIRSNKADYREQITINDLIDTKNKSYFTEGKFQEDFIKQFGASSDTNTSKLKPSTLSPQEERELIEELNKIKDSNKVQEFKFNSYLELMSSSEAWGGHRELVAMAQMLKVRIDISRDGNCITSCGEDFNTKIQLYHVKDIGNFPRWQDSTSHSKSPGKENISSHEKPRSSQTSAKRKISFSEDDNHASKKVKVSNLIEDLSEGCVPSGLTHSFHGSIYQVKLSMLFLEHVFKLKNELICEA